MYLNIKIFSCKFVFLDDGNLVTEIDKEDFRKVRDKYTGDNNTSTTEGFKALKGAVTHVGTEVKSKNRVVVPAKRLFNSFGEGLNPSEMEEVFTENLRDCVKEQAPKQSFWSSIWKLFF
jgi:hypothetical protein